MAMKMPNQNRALLAEKRLVKKTIAQKPVIYKGVAIIAYLITNHEFDNLAI